MTSPSKAIATRPEAALIADVGLVRSWLQDRRDVALAVRTAQRNCNIIPTTDAEAVRLEQRIGSLTTAIENWEEEVKPLRSGLHALRTELADLAGKVTNPAVEVRDEARQRLGGYRKRREAEHRAAAQEVKHASEMPAAPPKGRTRTVWVMEVGDEVDLEQSLRRAIRGGLKDGEGPNHELAACLRVHKPSLRKLLARPEGQSIIDNCKLVGVTVRSEDRAPTK